MDGESTFFFKANPMTSYRVNVYPERLWVRSVPAGVDRAGRSREWRTDFADVARVYVKELRGAQMCSESLLFQTRKDKSAGFGSVIGRLNGDPGQIIDYRQAAASAMQALAHANPDADVQFGQSVSAKTQALVLSLIVSLLLGLAAMFISGGPGFWGYVAFSMIGGLFMYNFYTRMGIGRRPTRMSAREAAAYFANRMNAPV